MGKIAMSRKGDRRLSLPSKDLMAAIAATRFGLGARPGEIDAAKADPQGFLIAQIRREGADIPQDDGESAGARFEQMRRYQQERRAVRQEKDGRGNDSTFAAQAFQSTQRDLRQKVNADFLARARIGAGTPASFRERWTLFWTNHFTVSATKQITSVLVGPFEREAIRPYVFSSFENLLVASSTHPAMLTYLDQALSIGPQSRAAQFVARRRNSATAGLNENLAREILELHTVGIDAGYTQGDVTEFARALTGFSIGREQDDRAGQFVFREQAHEPGPRTILGRRYAEAGVGQGLAVLRDLAADPRTARHVCGKIARHFVADVPPPSLVQRLEQRWMATGGDLAAVARTLVESPEAWDPTPAKIKTPYEYALSTWRLIGAEPSAFERIAPILTSLGQRPFAPPSPKGWPEDAQTWAAPDALIKRMQWAQGFAAAVADQTDPNALAASALGERLTPLAAKAVARAETRREAFALLIMSPEFQRR
ncbi:DUF1800 domain-containing protein [Caulobacter vibrioides]|uniref:DUF1800 domain-containing protein n=2 Tax=Caulobacter vibrioides TaxID=155892 RepID=Q9A6V5_CAUVC|nr:DUF1800 family protein [Caulobacter vibrioides]YP_002517430.1 conserved hypothetical protein [Caulobacter vibrioides NA1000]AAK23953.1 hypothetical protein CC_1978 [Caulobacter vibrioides CB15]ACL95522.1 conserved hypothetical protein [Caulobacter vibrioides NA1000]ATC28851.1 DUF1800 domain-containing protein [Caulobacter vibrioides]QXZ50363.1 DUF1800 family protein [Caulobacter vibrioides]